MRIEKYGITLHLLKEDDIEMVRQWRNDPSVVKNYGFRELITPEMQKAWFNSVNNNRNLYMIIEYEGQKVGVVNAKNIDIEGHKCESGIFIPDGKYSGTFLPGIVMIMTVELGFRALGFMNSYAHILKTNLPVRSMMKSVGYELCTGQENEENQLYVLTKETFEKKAVKLIKALFVMTGTSDPGRIVVDRSEMHDSVVTGWEEIAGKYAPIQRIEENRENRIYHFS